MDNHIEYDHYSLTTLHAGAMPVEGFGSPPFVDSNLEYSIINDDQEK
jgi:hypothetical protein